jgi:hypothetical protein
MDLSRPKVLALARKLALLTSPALVACASSSPPTVIQPSPVASTTPAASATGESPQSDPTAGSEPCRCSWDTNASAAPRVCKKGEVNYDGEKCIPGQHYGGYEGGPVMKGPLPPPDLPAIT